MIRTKKAHEINNKYVCITMFFKNVLAIFQLPVVVGEIIFILPCYSWYLCVVKYCASPRLKLVFVVFKTHIWALKHGYVEY